MVPEPRCDEDEYDDGLGEFEDVDWDEIERCASAAHASTTDASATSASQAVQASAARARPAVLKRPHTESDDAERNQAVTVANKRQGQPNNTLAQNAATAALNAERKAAKDAEKEKERLRAEARDAREKFQEEQRLVHNRRSRGREAAELANVCLANQWISKGTGAESCPQIVTGTAYPSDWYRPAQHGWE